MSTQCVPGALSATSTPGYEAIEPLVDVTLDILDDATLPAVNWVL